MKWLLLLALCCAGPANAGEGRTLRVVNDTSAPVNQLFVWGGRAGGLRAKVAGIIGPADDDRDRLDAKLLPRGGAVVIDLKGERCRYDIRAVLTDGRTYVGDDVDICADGVWPISRGARR